MRFKLLTIVVLEVGLVTAVCAAQSVALRSLPASHRFHSTAYAPQSGEDSEAQIALAKSGHSEELQRIYCELYDSRMGVIFEAGTAKLPRVGGWFAIKSYLQLFDADARFQKARPGASDLTYTPPSWWGLKALPNIVPDPPLQYNQQSVEKDSASQVEIWKKYIAEHESELMRLEPTGTAVEFSPRACRKGKPRTKHR